jgi:methionine-S-sulfoxide reductase
MFKYISFAFVLFFFGSCTSQLPPTEFSVKKDSVAKLDTIVLGGGCFWCTEAVYEQLQGVVSVASGYAGGTTVNPTYEQVCSGKTGHAEVIQLVYDSTKIELATILKVFFTVHDPTTLNRQGADVGTQYRSVVFFNNQRQQQLSTGIIASLNASGAYRDKIVTEVFPLDVFYKAEKYHQNYFYSNSSAPYCAFVIQPKLDKLEKAFAPFLRKE